MVEPLRIQKGTMDSSPQKPIPSRPLSELSPMTARRNSPSAQSLQQQLLDAPAFETSPFGSKFSAFTHKESPHLYWQNRESPLPTRGLENHEPSEDSAIASKRPSVENLKRASRVSKSNIFALEQRQEYDPMTSPKIERPLAPSRTLGNGMSLGLQARNSILDHNRFFEKKRTHPYDNEAGISPASPSHLHMAASPERARSPFATPQGSPTKSAMSQNPRFSLYDPETSIWSEADEYEERKLPPGKGLHRHAKSVTFNQSPQVNEYEQVTPDPSVSADSREGSYDEISEEEDTEDMRTARGGSQDSFDESLEDADKTPVVLPEDWRHMSPETANSNPTRNLDDPFVHGDARNEVMMANLTLDNRVSPTRTDSLNSNGSRRPLPPLPPPAFPRERTGSHDSFEAIAERASVASAGLHSPPQAAAISKDELRNRGSSSMSLEERLSLMTMREDDADATPRKSQNEIRERRMRRKSGLHNDVSEREIKIFEDNPQEDDEEPDKVGYLESHAPVPRISRESILRKVKSQKFENYTSPEPEAVKPESLPQLNPDEPIQSYEESPSFVEGDDSVDIKAEEDDSVVDMYTVPAHRTTDQAVSNQQEAPGPEDDTESQYSTDTASERKEAELDLPASHAGHSHLALMGDKELQQSDRMSMPLFGSTLSDDFGLSLSTYMTPSTQNSMTEVRTGVDVSADKSSAAQVHRSQTPDNARVPGYSDEELDEPSTPESVIRRSLSHESLGEAPEIPEPIATIKAPGSKMKTRPSLTPQDIRKMAETRRQVSGDHHPTPSVPERHANRPSMIAEADSFLETNDIDREDRNETLSVEVAPVGGDLPRLDFSVNDGDATELSFGLDKEFDRVIEAQKHHVKATDTLRIRGLNTDRPSRKQKGYLMRQNTKLVVASSGLNTSVTSDDASMTNKPSFESSSARETRSANNSPVKKQRHEISGAWQTHEWNGKTRRKSIRQSGGFPSEFALSDGVPPVPGLPSAVTEMESLSEADEPSSESPGGAERGRLFVRVVGVKDLNLPLSRDESTSFSLTLDNGLHCVTTQWLELNKSAPIGQEFELVVLDDLEFQLTLQVKLEQPKRVPRPESPTKSANANKKPGFSRFFGSPKKKREQEMKQEQDRLVRERQQNQARLHPSTWDLLQNLVAKDGTFARAYVSLKEHEGLAYGRPLTLDVPCFNEWAMEEARTINSTRAGRSTAMMDAMQRRAPYKVGKLELQLLYVPKPREAKDEDMPKSMSSCIREMHEAEKTSNQTHEGYLSQQGGDCPYWRRRFFRLSGSKLTAYHEATHQPRATINLAKAVKLIDDKTNLKQQTTAKSGGRRKSAFGSEEDGYMFLEEGFRIRFANGETIDFYADDVTLKDSWMQALADVVGRDSRPTKGWTDLVLRREKAAGASAGRGKEVERRKMGAPNKANSHAPASASASGTEVVPGPRSSSRGDSAKRPISAQGGNTSELARLKQGEIMGPPAPPLKDRKALDSAERRAKARSTYY